MDKKIILYISKISLNDYYITKNVCSLIETDYDFIINNLYLLGMSNLNYLNSLDILLQNKKFDFIKKIINIDIDILNVKNSDEKSLLRNILNYDEMYGFLLDYLKQINISNNKNSKKIIDFITEQKYKVSIKLISLLSKFNDLQILNIVLEIIKMFNKYCFNEIYKIEYVLFITLLCKHIYNDKLLQILFNSINIKCIKLYQDDDNQTFIDYLIYNKNINTLKNIIGGMDYIYFCNDNENSLFFLIDNYEKYENKNLIIDIILNLINKSNIYLINDNNGTNILLKLLPIFKINSNVAIKIISTFIDKFNIFRKNTFGDSIFSVITKMIGKKSINIFKSEYNVDSQIIIENPYKINLKKINYEFNPSKILTKTNISNFHNEQLYSYVYTIIIMKQYKNILIPCLKTNKNKQKNNQKLIKYSNNCHWYLHLFSHHGLLELLPSLIIWKNINEYYMNENLVDVIKASTKQYVVIKLSIDFSTTYHANIIIIDTINKSVERFEPYGNLLITENLNLMLINELSNKLGYTFNFYNDVGLQSRSDELNRYNTVIGDPGGFCLAWCMLFLELRINKKYKDWNTYVLLEVLNNYITNTFNKKYNIDNQNSHNEFIRFYTNNLHFRKNKLFKKYNIDYYLLEKTDDFYMNEKISGIMKKELIK